jgi:deoxyribodipyrimidine photo-lyase
MAPRTIQEERICRLNDSDARRGNYVLYWMQQSQRAECNHALEYAVQRANELGQPAVVAFGLMDDYPDANLRHYRFMLEGLQDTRKRLERRGIRMVVQLGRPDDVALSLGAAASVIVCDRGYLRHQKAWRQRVARDAGCEVVQVESDVVVPVDTASNKPEFAARTIRPKVTKLWGRFLIDLRSTPLKRDSLGIDLNGVDLSELDSLLDQLQIDCQVKPVSRWYRGGTTEAKKVLGSFLRRLFADYASHRNRPEHESISHMSMYLHFGHISPVHVALKVSQGRGREENNETYIEELLVRRELAQNFVNFTANYDRFQCLPEWAKRTLAEHKPDERQYVYTRSRLEDAATHDPYWNAAMQEMKHTGYMHNYMRMYWGKKILEWSQTPQYAFQTALALNNKYFLDGRDANSYANVAWVFGMHDRPFTERPVYGKVRCMMASGLERKCNIRGYVQRVEAMIR